MFNYHPTQCAPLAVAAKSKKRGSHYPLGALLPAIWLATATPVLASDAFSGLDEASQSAITRLCTPLQFTQGAVAYRSCLQQQLNAQDAAQNTASERFSIDERYAIQRACASKRTLSPAEYSSCTQEQIAQMAQMSEPVLSAIAPHEQYMVAQQCFQTQTSAGARAYRECANAALASLTPLPRADFAERSNVERSNIQLECSISSGDVATYRKCLLNALGIEFEQSKAVLDTLKPDEKVPSDNSDAINIPTTADGAAPGPLSNATLPDTDANEARVRPDSRQINQDAIDVEQSASQGIEPEDPRQSTAIDTIWKKTASAALTLFRELETRIAAMTPSHWITLLVTLSVSLLLLIIRSARKARKLSRNAIAARPDLTPATIRAKVFPADIPARLDEPYDAYVPARSAIVDERARYHVPESTVPSEQSASVNTGRFAEWLSHFNADQQQEYAIEFLIYWIAYADSRYDPALKHQVFRMKNPDIPNLIKRWVFMKDANAFADAIGYLQKNTDSTQKRQILDLLMALLVNERALTPVQNNLLRFLSDVFGIGNTELNKQFHRAYGQYMPDVPRPDKVLWWDQIEPGQKIRWDARAIARKPEQLRHRVALGQPLKGELDNELVEKSFQLALARCQPDRVDMLGERETQLLESKRNKFVLAHSALMEVMT